MLHLPFFLPMPQVSFFFPEDMITPPASPEIPGPPPSPSISDSETVYGSRPPTPAIGLAEHRGLVDVRLSPSKNQTCYMPLAVWLALVLAAAYLMGPVFAVLFTLQVVINAMAVRDCTARVCVVSC